MEEPYSLRPADIATLTDAQIIGMFGRPRDEKGVPKPVGVEERRKYVTPEEGKETFLNLMRMFGKSSAEAEAMWVKKKGG